MIAQNYFLTTHILKVYLTDPGAFVNWAVTEIGDMGVGYSRYFLIFLVVKYFILSS